MYRGIASQKKQEVNPNTNISTSLRMCDIIHFYSIYRLWQVQSGVREYFDKPKRKEGAWWDVATWGCPALIPMHQRGEGIPRMRERYVGGHNWNEFIADLEIWFR